MSARSNQSLHAYVRVPISLALALVVGLATGCNRSSREQQATDAGSSVERSAGPPAQGSPSVRAASGSGQSGDPALVPVDATEIPEGASVTVEQVLSRASARNPSREVFAAMRAAAQAEVQVARAWANPELELSGGQARARSGGADESVYGVAVRQRFEMPGRRSARIEAARAGQAVADREVAIDALALEGAVREACLRLAVAEAALVRSEAALDSVQQMHRAVERRAEAGEAEPGEFARAKLELITTTAEKDRDQRQVAASRAAVRIWAGGDLPERFTIADALTMAPPALVRDEVFAAAAERNPRLALLRAAIDARGAELTREQRAWQPDVTVGAFSDRDRDANNLGLTLGVAVPVWNRNQGGIALAEAYRRRAEAQLRAEQQAALRDLEMAWQSYESRRLALGSLANDARAAAKSALDAKLSAFAAGEGSLLDVLEARRASRAVDNAVLEAASAAGGSLLELGRAVGSFTFLTAASAGDQP